SSSSSSAASRRSRGSGGLYEHKRRHMTDIDNARELREEARAALSEALHEIKRVIVGQDAMLERLLVSLLAGGRVPLEGGPRLAKALTVKTLASVLRGSHSPIQFTPDLVPPDLVRTPVQ